MTEDEAKKKWCEKRAIVKQLKLLNSFIVAHIGKTEEDKIKILAGMNEHSKKETDNCIASDCVWWMWNIRRNLRGEETLHPFDGHCGLAAK